MIQDVHPGSGSRIRILIFTHPGFKGQKGTGSATLGESIEDGWRDPGFSLCMYYFWNDAYQTCMQCSSPAGLDLASCRFYNSQRRVYSTLTKGRFYLTRQEYNEQKQLKRPGCRGG
jgi:hypothetical protein